MIDIRDKNSAIRTSVEITDQCIYSKKLMEEEYILLSFESDVLISFAKGDYIQTSFGVFRIVEINRPHQSSNGGYLYEQKFHADWERWRNHIVFYDRQKGSEKSWKMTQTPEYFLDIIASNIQKAGYGRYSFDIDSELTEMKLVEFDSTNIIDGLTKVAEAWNSEWWISDRIIHLSKCEYGSPLPLTENDELGIIDREDSSDTNYFTRAYVFGSTRNLPKNYRKNADGSVVIEGIVETRLKLPAGVPYIDAWEAMKDEDVVEGVILLDEVYPRRVGTIATITTKKYTDEIENEDGSKTYEDWNAFRFTDKGLVFSADYILPGEELRIVFQSGKLAGMDFAVIFNPEAVAESNTSAQIFEIVRNDSYGVNLPTDDFKPAVGDTYILYGYDTKFVYNQLVSEAETELYTKGREKLAEIARDKSVYNCPTNPVRCAGYRENSLGNLVHSSINEIDLDVGQAVILRSNNHFAGGSRASRVRGFEKKLKNKFDATYIIGETSAYSRGDALEEQVQQLTYQSKQFINVYGNSVYVVGRYDHTAPSDTNVPSFKRAQSEFLQKNVPDRAMEKIIFDKGAEFGDYIKNEQGASIDRQGNAELLTLIVRHLLRSPQFVNGMTGEGFRLWLNNEGLAELELDRLTVRQIMTVFELIIDRIRAVGGQIIVSAANGKIKSVTDAGDSYMITFEGDNYFQPHDLMRCQVFTGNNVRGYWAEILAVNGNSVIVAKSEFNEWGTEPQEGDECVLMGNTENELRQNLISISATEDGQPRIDVLDGVDGKNLNNALRARLGNLDGISDSWFPLDNQPHGNGLYADNAYLRGTFLLTTGEDIKTKFEIVEGKIESSIEAIRQDFMQDKGYLNNPTFGDGLTYWTSENETVFFILGNRWIWANDNILSKKGDGASVITDDNRRVVRIKNKYIIQKYADLRGVPEIKTNEDGYKEPTPVYLSFFYKVKTAGTLQVKFENINNTGFVDYIPLEETIELEPTSVYQQMTLSGLWNGTGDFKLSFTGEIFLYMLVLSTDKIEALTHTYRTLFEQSERLVKISAAIFDRNEAALLETGLIVKPEGAGLYAMDAEGGWASIGVMATGEGGSKAVIQADHIQLEGLVTANGNFKILEDGSIETTNGKFTGILNATRGILNDVVINGTIRTPFRDGYYNLGIDGWISLETCGIHNTNNVVIPGKSDSLDWEVPKSIPWTADYNGFRAIVMNDSWGNKTPGLEWSVEAPAGKYFFEDGQQKNTLVIEPRSGVEMIGYGEGDTFKGWMILNRIFRSNHHNGFNLKVMFSGRVSSAGALIDLKTYNGENITVQKISTGHRVIFGQSFNSVNNYMVFVTGYGSNNARYASVSAQTTDYFEVFIGDDSSANEGGFSFMVINTNNSYGYY